MSNGVARRNSDVRVAVAIPTFNEVQNIERITQLIDNAVQRQSCPEAYYIVNIDNGSTDGTAELFRELATASSRLGLSTGPSGGKGSNLFRLLELLEGGDADIGVTLDADLRAVPRDWLETMVQACTSSSPRLSVPLYSRPVNDGNLTDHLVAPLMLASSGVPIRQPIGGDLAMNRAFASIALSQSWPEGAFGFGVDSFLVHLATDIGAAWQTPLEIGKHHGWRRSHPRAIYEEFLPKCREVVVTLLDLLARPYWQRAEIHPLPKYPSAPRISEELSRRHDPEIMCGAAVVALDEVRNSRVLYELCDGEIPSPWEVLDERWSAILFRVVQKWDKVRAAPLVVESIVALLFCRIVTAQAVWIDEPPRLRDQRVHRIATMLWNNSST